MSAHGTRSIDLPSLLSLEKSADKDIVKFASSVFTFLSFTIYVMQLNQSVD